MVEMLAYLGCLVAVLLLCYKIRLTSSDPGVPGRVHLIGFVVCLGGGLAIDGWMTTIDPNLPAVAGLAADELKMASLGFLVLFANTLRPTVVLGRRCLVLTGATLVLVAALFFASGADQNTEVVTFAPDRVPFFVAYDLVLMAYETWGLVTFIVLIGRYARMAAPGLLRTGLRLIIAGAAVAVAWSAWQLDDIRMALTDHQNDTYQDWPSAALATGCVLLATAGATLTAWGPVLSVPVRWLAARLRYRRIQPLWGAVHAVMPAIALDAAARQQGGVEFALYRHVIEIRDAQLALRTHVHPDVAGWAAQAVARHGTARKRQAATVEAATIAAALLAYEASREYQPGDSTPHLVEPNLRAETSWLGGVARELRRSPVVADVRQHMIEELTQPATHSG